MMKSDEGESNRIVVALGGNAIIQRNQKGTLQEQLENIRSICRQLVDIIIKDGIQLVITHGNGPQVGNIMLQNEIAQDTVPPMPLDICGAQSQGQIGYLLTRELRSLLRKASDKEFNISAIVTHCLVNDDDPAFTHPTKPIGPIYEQGEAERLRQEKGYKMAKDNGKGWRRIVPSPEPVEILESKVIKSLVKKEVIVVASGGGGIPVVWEDGNLSGKEAVIDKDLAASKLAIEIHAHILLILTDIEKVKLNYGKDDETPIDYMSVEEAVDYMEKGHFAEGSMKPKVKACIRFVEAGGQKAVITSLDKAMQGLLGEAGTTIC